MPRNSKSGFSLIELVTVIAIICILIGLALPVIQSVREAARKVSCSSQLRQIGLALENRHVAFGAYSSGTKGENSKTPYRSWLADVLPYLENTQVFSNSEYEFGTGTPYHLHEAFRQQPVLYCCPSDPRTGVPQYSIRHQTYVGLTSFLGVNGTNWNKHDGVLFLNSNVRDSDIRDGKSNTIIVGERPPSPAFDYGWWYGGHGYNSTGALDHHLGASETAVSRFAICPPSISMNGIPVFDLRDECSVSYFWSTHGGGWFVLRADGSTHFMTHSNDRLLSALATRDGGEVVQE
jgi:prepilin-type N-terminal cleavage/methylation domain-containing protein